MTILVDEEYGFAYWLWEPEVIGENLVRLFQQVVLTDEKFFVDENYKKRLGGIWTRINYEKRQEIVVSNEFDAHAHLHESDDSYLTFPENGS